MARHFRVAIIGVGAISKQHAMSIADLDNASLVGGSCRGADKGRAFCAEWGGTYYADYREMLDTEKPDMVCLCTPSGLHLEPTQECAKRGIHVLCEKPLEITTARVDAMIAAADAAGITLGGIFPQRYVKVVRTIHDAAAAGRFGNLAVANTFVPWWRDDAYYAPDRWQGTQDMDGGGAMINQSIHGIDTIQWLAGAAMSDLNLAPEECPIEEVTAYTAKRGHPEDMIEVEDTGVAAMKFRNGALGLILATTSMFPGGMRRIQISGRDGTAEIQEEDLLVWAFREDQSDDGAIREEFAPGKGFAGSGSDPQALDYRHHRANIIDFLDALDSGTAPSVSGVEARKAVAIIEAVYKSAASGEPVKVK